MATSLGAQVKLVDLLSSEHSAMLDAGAPMGGEAPVVVWQQDSSGVSVLDFSGDYSRLVEGSLNLSARTAVAQEFFVAHADTYDFLIVFSTFDFDRAGAVAFHISVRNDVEGIGLPDFDESGVFGSDSTLRGYVDMGPLDELESDPLDPGFESTLAILMHELFHQWGAYVSFNDGGEASGDLLQSDGAHWSFLLDSDASVLYGNDWLDNGDGTFTARDALRVLSPLDLYLGGFYGSAEISELTLLQSPTTPRG